MARTNAKKANQIIDQAELFHDAKKDLNPFWSSSLFSDVYLKNDLPREYRAIWDNDEIGGFYNFYQGFIDLCNSTEHEAFENWKEADTVKNWIVPVMGLLGWEDNSERHQNSYIDNTSFTLDENSKKQVYRPDLLYFDKPQHKKYTQEKNDADEKLREARDKKTGVKIVVEAKHWNNLSTNSSLSKKHKENEDSASSLGPELQTLKYIELFKLDFGILTDGKTWKLYNSELSQGLNARNFKFDLGKLREVALQINRENNEQVFRNYAKFFYHFFSKESLSQTENAKTVPFVYQILNYSKKYVSEIEYDLKKRFIITMGITCNALKRSSIENKEKPNLELIRNVAESHLFNILFVKSCEVRRILPVSSPSYIRYSLHEIIESLDEMRFDPEKDWDDYLRDFKFGSTFGGNKFDFDGYSIFDRFINLYEVIHDGSSKEKDFGFEIEGFKESIFTKEEWRFAKGHKLNNKEMIQILFSLNFTESDFKERKYQQIPYSFFTPRQLGSIYESFLEFNLEEANTDLIFSNGQWKQANLKSKHVGSLKLHDHFRINKGQLFFSPDNEDRKITGSYYTPDFIVKFLINNTLDNTLKNKSHEELLNIKICDPSMGSGHFLSGALDYLVQKYREKWSEKFNDDLKEDIFETSRKILDKCLYGVDINPRAVKLAKMSMWLATAYPGKKLERLDDQFKTGDSLVGFNWKSEFKEVFKNNSGFDLVVGNPPYIRTQNLNKDALDEYKKNYEVATKGNFDIYNVFIELSTRIVNPIGDVAFILPHKFFVVDSGEPLRKFLIDGNYLDRIYNLNQLQVFENATTYTCLLFLTKRKKDSFKYSNIHSFDGLENSKPITYELSSLSSNKWEFGSSESKGILSKIRSQKKSLEDVCPKIFQGIATSADSVFLLEIQSEDSKYVWGHSKELNKTVKIEKGILLPVLKGSDITSFKLNKNHSAVIFPYSVTGEKYTPIPLASIKKNFPETFKYLNENYEKLIERSKTDESNWWLYPYPKNITYYKKPKIILQVLSNKAQFGVDTQGEYCFVGGGTAGGNAILVDNLSADDTLLLTGILNSALCTYYVKQTSSSFRGGYFSFGKSAISTLPMQELEKIKKPLRIEIINSVKLLMKKFDQKVMNDLNESVFELYGLSVAESKEILQDITVSDSAKEKKKVA